MRGTLVVDGAVTDATAGAVTELVATGTTF